MFRFERHLVGCDSPRIRQCAFCLLVFNKIFVVMNTLVKAVESDMRVKGLMREDEEDRTKWRTMLWGAKG